jgi:tetratricopeptide (TPR) repeat protein
MSITTKRSTSRSATRHSSGTGHSRKRVFVGKKSTRLRPATKRSPAGKARARKATKLTSAKRKVKSRAPVSKKRTVRASTKAPRVKKPIRKALPVRRASKAKPNFARRVIPLRKTPPPPPPPLTHDEAAAIRAFEQAHKEFSRGRFSDARNQFRSLVDRYPNVSEVAARARTYLAVAEARMRAEIALPRDADSLYDRGVIELNRGEYVAAQELFERALKREPEAAHIHYGLAATRARLGAIDTALASLRRALDLQPNLRIRAQRDHDLSSLHSDPEFEQLVFASRE